MTNSSFLDNKNDEEIVLFKRCIRKLLDATFIVRDKDANLYDYLTYASNRMDISAYLKFMAYDVVVDDELKYAMLIQNEQDKDTVGLKRINRASFSSNEIQLLLVLWLLFLQRFGKEEQTYVEFGDIIDMQKQYGIIMSPTELKNALRTFKRYSLINLNDADINEKTVVTLYPTLQFALNKEQFMEVVNQYCGELTNADLIEEDDMEDSDE